jgi:hypothetical protein
VALMHELFDHPVYLKDGTRIDCAGSATHLASNDLNELRGAIRLMADNFSPTQPRDARGRFASTGGGRVALPIGISKEQRAQLTPEERAQWNKGWNEIAKLKRAAKAEKDPARALQHTLKVEGILAKLKDIRAAGDARLKGGGTVQKKHGKDDKKQENEVEDHAKIGGGTAKKVQKKVDKTQEKQKLLDSLSENIKGSGVDLIHLGALRHDMRHLTDQQFHDVVHALRREGRLSLTGAEGRFGISDYDKKHTIREKDPVTGLDSILLYASLRGGVGTAGAKSGLTRQLLTDRLLNAPSAAGPAHSLSVVAKRAAQAEEMLKIMDEHSAAVGPVRRHGMSAPEEMHGMVIEGTHFQWSQATKDRSARAIAEIVQAGTNQKIWDANHTVVLSAQKSKDDSYWETAYNEKGFASAATGGDGHVVGYRIDQHGMTADTFHHESGHNFAFKVWGNTSPLVYGPTHEGKASDGYARAQKKEKPVTTYGAKSPAEDFAEAVRLYSSAHPGQKEKFKKNFPLKYRAIEDLLGVPPAPVS